MSTLPNLIERILPEAGIVSARVRCEVERELACHLEDLRADLESSGQDRRVTESLVEQRFGDAGEVARAFANVYRAERRALYTASLLGLGVLCWSASSVLVAAVQFGLGLSMGFAPARLFSPQHMLWEALQVAALTANCLGLHFAERRFECWPQVKAMAVIGAFSVPAAWGLELRAPGHSRLLLIAFLCAILMRAVRAAVSRRLLWFAGTALFGSLGFLAAHSPAQALFASVWIALAASCQFTTLLAGAFESRVLRRPFV